MGCVYSCFNLKDTKVTSATLSVGKSDSPQVFYRFGTYFEVHTVSPYIFPDLTICPPLEEFSSNFKFF